MDTVRLNRLHALLWTALDSDEEYLYQGEMSDYARSYAVDAGMELRELLRATPPGAEEMALIVEALAEPGRRENGRSRALLLLLRDASRPLLDALADSADPALRRFALECAQISLNPYFHDPLYGSITLVRRLLDDPDEAVRVAALAAARPMIEHNASTLRQCVAQGRDTPMLAFLARILTRLDDPSPTVRAEAAALLGQWGALVGEATLGAFLAREGRPELRARLSIPGTGGGAGHDAG